MRRVLDGDAEAYGVLVSRYEHVLFRYAERMTGRYDDAADLVQAAFVKAYRNLDHCRNPERVGAWLFGITANACKDFLKDRRRRNVSLQDTREPAANRGDPEQRLGHVELGEMIDRALRQLVDEQREAFLLKHVEGRSYVEMSEVLGASVPALKMRVHRAREELQMLLNEYRQDRETV